MYKIFYTAVTLMKNYQQVYEREGLRTTDNLTEQYHRRRNKEQGLPVLKLQHTIIRVVCMTIEELTD